MSTPDARLNAAERAALADLEAAAIAADPALAARLRGGPGWWAGPALRSLRRGVARTWAAVLGSRWWGVPLAACGMLLMAVGLGVTLALSAVGAVVTAVGIRVLAEMAAGRIARAATTRGGGAGGSSAG